jgi:hypothetical protein
MDQIVIRAAKEAHNHHWHATSDESVGDTQSTAVVSAWQDALTDIDPTRFEAEAPVCDAAKERIDLIDHKNMVGYELKASGNNPQHEFYKDIFKVLTYNHFHDEKLSKFVFLNEPKGIKRLRRNGLASLVIASAKDLSLEIHLVEL